MLDVRSDQYRFLRNALLQIQQDLSAVLSVLQAQSDNGDRFVKTAYAELRRALAQGRLSDAEVVGQLLSVILRAQDGGVDDELADNKIHQEAHRWLIDGIGAILSRDTEGGISHLENLTGAVYCNESLQWAAWLWMARAAAEAGDLVRAAAAARKAEALAVTLDVLALGTSLCIIGEIELLARRPDSALEQFQRAAESLEGLDDARGLAAVWLGRARSHLAAGRHKLGLEAVNRAAELDQAWDQSVVWQARLALVEGDIDRAEAVVQRVGDQEPVSNQIATLARILERVRAGQLPLAAAVSYYELSDRPVGDARVAELGQLVAEHASFLEARESLAWTLARIGRDDAAAREFDQLAERELPADLQSSVLLGLGCLANRRSQRREPAARIHAAAHAADQRPQLGTSENAAVAVRPDKAKPSDAALAASRGGSQVDGGRVDADTALTSVGATKAVFTGDLQLLAVPDLLEFLKSSRRTGTLIITSEDGIGAVHFRRGNLTGAAAPSCPSLGEVLVQEGAISPDDLKSADGLKSPTNGHGDSSDRLLGGVLVEVGVAEEATVRKALSQQIHTAIQHMVEWTAGRFSFEPDQPGDGTTPSGAIDVELDTQGVLLEVLRRIDERSR